MVNTLPQVAADRGIDHAKWAVLKYAIFPGASDEMMSLVLDYCQARGLDPLQKPVHIVKCEVNGRWVETIWEGIGSHRTRASRTGQYVGQDEPQFGPEKKGKWGHTEVKYPEWCKVTVYRLVRGLRCPFTSCVYWQEAFASARGGAPNFMWQKRPYGQLSKVAEAQALRMAFPDHLGASPTAEEMEGRSMNDTLEPRFAPAESFDAVVEGRGRGNGGVTLKDVEPDMRRIEAELDDCLTPAQVDQLSEKYRALLDNVQSWSKTRVWWEGGGEFPSFKAKLEDRKKELANGGPSPFIISEDGEVVETFSRTAEGVIAYAERLKGWILRLLDEQRSVDAANLWNENMDGVYDWLSMARRPAVQEALNSLVLVGKTVEDDGGPQYGCEDESSENSASILA